jgi:hypothetical protein
MLVGMENMMCHFCAPDQGMPWPREHIEALNIAVDECDLYPSAAG